MDSLKQSIVSLFKSKGTEISTGEILAFIYPEIKQLRDRKDNASKRRLAQEHRKLLYHINELVESGVLRFIKFGEKGSKYFVLNLGEGEELTELSPRFKKRMIVSRPVIPAMPIESYEHQGIVFRYEPSTWIDKLNSVVIMCDKLSNLKELEKLFENSIAVINDCICFDKFDSIFDKASENEILEFIEKINQESYDCGKKVSCIMGLHKINRVNFRSIIEKFSEFKDKNINFIYDINSEEFQENFNLFKDLINFYIGKKSILYIKNRNIQKAAYYPGTAGMYCLSDRERSEKENCLVIACSQSSLIVDVEKFYSLYGLDNEKFSQLMLNISRSFLSANSIQRRKSQEYFKEIISLDKKNDKEFLEFSRNYIRFWNYGLAQPGIEPQLVLNMVSEAKKKVEQFSLAEETIYKSCGMPLRFKIALSCAFREADSKLSGAKYRSLQLNNIEDIYKPRIRKEILEKENITSMFDGGNDITFHRTGLLTAEDIYREISVVLNTYKMPLFSYSFENIRGDMKITSFF